MLRFKDNNVRVTEIRPQLLLGITMVYSVYEAYGYDCIITSLNDSTHSKTSLHYSGSAADFRIKNLDGYDKDAVIQEVLDLFKDHPDFDCILEATHIHLEYQPRKD
mgnify:CR=1 FL=1|tara:strand:+ start:2913 stop:3230 length:318 start_codon:yes stop_codon:yes gene_type:complete